MDDPAGRSLTVYLEALDRALAAPAKARVGDAAVDLPAREGGVIGPGQRRLVPTGFAVAVPDRVCALVLPRSGLALNSGVTVLNAPGLIDSGYRGEIKVVLINHGDEDFVFERGQRIAQLLVLPVPDLTLALVGVLPAAPDDRGVSGFGSTG
ncbi:MAG: dUTP diphosphatase [Actinomycetota bacterium]|nr:dUTP diphosphatase [Actinomycetota bacterium]